MTIGKFTVGADPELFIINTRSNKVVSAVGKVPGTKENPYKIPNMLGYTLQVDNILVEFNIPPCNNQISFVKSIENMKNYIRNYVRSINPNYDILCASSQDVPKSQLRSKQANEFGCSPDYNVYTNDVNEKPDPTSTTMRSAGFHLHIGYDNSNIDTSLELIKYLDAFIGIPSILLDDDTERRKIYGKAGCFRLKPYGLEYRSLGSSLMKDTESIRWIWIQLEIAICSFNSGCRIPNDDDIQEIINESNIELAKYLIEEYRLN